MEARDFLLTPLFLLVIYPIAFFIRNKFYNDSPLKEYFIPGLSVKLFGAFFSAIIYWYYYGAGDTIYYFLRTKSVYENVYEHNVWIFLRVIFADTSAYDPDIYYIIKSVRGWDPSMFMVLRFSFFLSMFTACSCIGISFLFAALSFSGVWKLFETFSDINPELRREFAISCLFIPSVFFWGSGIFKDTLALGFVGWFTHAIYMVFIKRRKIPLNVFIMLIAFYVLSTIKAYIIMAFLPSLLFWIFFKYRDRIKNDFIRKVITPLIIVVSFAGAYIAIQSMGGDYWSVSQMTTRAKDMQWWHTEVRKLYGEGGGGSYYSIGTGDFSLGNIIVSFPLAVNVTFFRPYLWEAKSAVMLMSAIESLVLFIFFLKIVFNIGLGSIARISVINPEVFFALLFSIIFAFAVGFTSFNFGALVRYKIPCIPFFVMALYMIRHYGMKNKGIAPPPEPEPVDEAPKEFKPLLLRK